MIDKFVSFLLLLFLLAACNTLDADTIQQTVEANDQQLVTEAAALSTMASDDRAAVALKVASAETQAAVIDSVNDQLYSTLAAGSTATVAVVRGIADPNSSDGSVMNDFSPEGLDDYYWQKLSPTGVSDQVDSIGCVVNPRQSFPPTVDTLYATMLAVNIEAGTPLMAEWYHEGVLRVVQTWIVDITSRQRCVWFSLDWGDTELTPGSWTVILHGDRALSPENFVITE